MHRYRVTLEKAPDAGEGPGSPISFEFESHDDIEQILERPSPSATLTDDERLELTVGLKLFGGVMLRHRDDPLFRDLQPHFGAFMKRLKSGRGSAG